MALGCDDAYAPALAVALRSLLLTTAQPERLTVWVMDMQIAYATRRRLERVLDRVASSTDLRWVTVDPERLTDLAGSLHLSPAAYLRVLLADLLPVDVDQVLWVDVDVMVVDDVTALAGVRLGDAPLAAVRDFEIQDTRTRKTYSLDREVSGFSDGTAERKRAYFNTGVLLLNLERWRACRWGEVVLGFARVNAPVFADQDAMNATLGGRQIDLPSRWNVQGALFHLDSLRTCSPDFTSELRAQEDALRRDPGIVHFSGGTKPWHGGSRHPWTRAWVRSFLRSGYLSPWEALRWSARWAAARVVSRIKAAKYAVQVRTQ